MIATDARRIAAIVALAMMAGCQPADSGNAASTMPIAKASTAPVAPTAPVSASPSATTALSAYVGKYPFDAVDGVTFLANPAVVRAVDALVPDAAIRALVLGGDGPGAPIAMLDGKSAAWGCETHNCGDHDWTILIASNGSGQVCYHDAAGMQNRSRWYVAAGKTEMRDGGCPSA